MILMTALIPVLLFGTKYLLDLRTLHKVQIENGDDENIEYEKVSAKEAAKAVAENWNPGLTLDQQKDAVYKVVDTVYNNAVSYRLSLINRSMKGIDAKRWKKSDSKSGIYDPLQIEQTDMISIRPEASTRIVDYKKDLIRYDNRYGFVLPPYN